MSILHNKILRKTTFAVLLFSAVVLTLFVFSSFKTEAKTFTIKTPDQFKNINWKGKGYGPGHTYKIGNDFTLGEGEYATSRLTKGKFTIDFNGHTVQNYRKNLAVLTISGADVTLMDSKVKANKSSIRSYGAGAIDMQSGKLLIKNGNYIGISDGTNNPVGISVGGGSCIINGGYFYGDYVGASASKGATVKINGGSFNAGYMYGFMDFGGANIKISKAKFKAGSKYAALGAYTAGEYYNFNKWLASKASFSTDFETVYYNGASTYSYYPSSLNAFYAISYNTPDISISNTMGKPASTSIKSLKASKKAVTVKWKKQTKNTDGYVIQYSKSKSFKKGNKTITVKGKSKTSKKIKKLKKKKKYYFRIRTYKTYNGMTLYSKWSKTKSKKAK